MATSSLLVALFISCVAFTSGQQDRKFFRDDYTYLPSTDSFYKIQTEARTWVEAKKRCDWEGAELFYPENDEEANEVIKFWNSTQPSTDVVHVGLQDLLVTGNFETIDGRPISQVYNKWGNGEPNNAEGYELCVTFNLNGDLNDILCDKRHPAICKKKLKDVQWNKECNMPYTDYIYNATLNTCYKFHQDPMNFTEALQICRAELSYLAIINGKSEDDYLIKLIDQKKLDSAPGLTLVGAVYIGFDNQLQDGWKTIKGQTLEEAGWTWSEGSGQPDGADRNEVCGSMFYTGQLNDLACSQRCFYICEHEIVQPAETLPPPAQQPQDPVYHAGPVVV